MIKEISIFCISVFGALGSIFAWEILLTFVIDKLDKDDIDKRSQGNVELRRKYRRFFVIRKLGHLPTYILALIWLAATITWAACLTVELFQDGDRAARSIQIDDNSSVQPIPSKSCSSVTAIRQHTTLPSTTQVAPTTKSTQSQPVKPIIPSSSPSQTAPAASASPD